MANGILIVDKPAGWTSQDVVAKLRGVFHEKRIGHGGTLDPMATGVLPVFLGRATRAVEFFEHADKTYLAALRPGVVTDTQDITGTVLHEQPADVSPEALAAVLPRFLGPQEQVPPMYSAIKVGGKKLYELARAGKEVARKPRQIEIFSLDPCGTDGQNLLLRVHCSKGTYVRTLCHDIGAALGCGGCMAALRREQAGVYTLAQAVPLEELLHHPDPASLLMPVDSLFAALPAAALFAPQEKKCRNGTAFSAGLADGRWRLYGQNGEFLALAAAENGTVRTIKSFFEVSV